MYLIMTILYYDLNSTICYYIHSYRIYQNGISTGTDIALDGLNDSLIINLNVIPCS